MLLFHYTHWMPFYSCLFSHFNYIQLFFIILLKYVYYYLPILEKYNKKFYIVSSPYYLGTSTWNLYLSLNSGTMRKKHDFCAQAKLSQLVPRKPVLSLLLLFSSDSKLWSLMPKAASQSRKRWVSVPAMNDTCERSEVVPWAALK